MNAVLAPTSFVHAPDVLFRASRNYVHSTDLYEELLAGARRQNLVADGPIEMRIKRSLTRQPEFLYARSRDQVSGDSPIVFTLSAGNVTWHGGVAERVDAAIEKRKPYNEKAVWDVAVQDGRSIRIEHKTGMAPIETVTALGVLLHRHLFPVAQSRKWLLTRIDLARPLMPQDANVVRVEVIRHLGTTMTRSSVTGPEGPFGYLEFMLGSAE